MTPGIKQEVRSQGADMIVKSRRGGIWFSSWPLFAVIAYFVGSIVFISPLGDFPLNDAHAYGWSVKTLLETGQLRLSTVSTACYLPVILGAALCKLFGFSFVVLRLMNLSVSLVGIVALYLVIRELGLRHTVAGLICLVYAANPLFLNVSFSFMTDPMFLALSNLYFLFMLKGVHRNSRVSFSIATLFLLMNLAVRQISALFIVCNIVLLLTFWWRKKLSLSLVMLLAVAPLCGVWLVEAMIGAHLEGSHVYDFYKLHMAKAVESLIVMSPPAWQNLLKKLGEASCYLGLFCLPLVFGFAASLTRSIRRGQLGVAIPVIISLVMSAWMVSNTVFGVDGLMPFSLNIWRLSELGSAGIIGTCIRVLSLPQRLAVTVSGLFAGAVIFAAVGVGVIRACTFLHRAQIGRANRHAHFSSFAERRISVFAFCFSAFFVSMSFVLVQLQVIDFDRYYLAVLLPLFSVVAVVWRWLGVRPVWALALIACFAIVIYATTLQQHYMSWNRARWNAVAELEKNGINSDNIDGGAEYIFWTDPSIFSLVKTRIGNPYFSRQTRGAAPQNDLRWWPVKGEDYILSFDSLPGCDVYGRQPFWSSVLNRQSCIYVLKRRPDFNPGKAREGGHVK